jgi:hypothetical protein
MIQQDLINLATNMPEFKASTENIISLDSQELMVSLDKVSYGWVRRNVGEIELVSG